MLERIRRFLGDENGMEMVEWAILAAVFAVAVAVFWQDLGGALDDSLDSVANALREEAGDG